MDSDERLRWQLLNQDKIEDFDDLQMWPKEDRDTYYSIAIHLNASPMLRSIAKMVERGKPISNRLVYTYNQLCETGRLLFEEEKLPLSDAIELAKVSKLEQLIILKEVKSRNLKEYIAEYLELSEKDRDALIEKRKPRKTVTQQPKKVEPSRAWLIRQNYREMWESLNHLKGTTTGSPQLDAKLRALFGGLQYTSQYWINDLCLKHKQSAPCEECIRTNDIDLKKVPDPHVGHVRMVSGESPNPGEVQ